MTLPQNLAEAALRSGNEDCEICISHLCVGYAFSALWWRVQPPNSHVSIKFVSTIKIDGCNSELVGQCLCGPDHAIFTLDIWESMADSQGLKLSEALECRMWRMRRGSRLSLLVLHSQQQFVFLIDRTEPPKVCIFSISLPKACLKFMQFCCH